MERAGFSGSAGCEHADGGNEMSRKPVNGGDADGKKRFAFNIYLKIIVTFLAVALVMGSVSIFPLANSRNTINKYNAVLNNVILAQTIITLSGEVYHATRPIITDSENEALRSAYTGRKTELYGTLDELQAGLMSPKSVSVFAGYRRVVDSFLEQADAAIRIGEGITTEERLSHVERAERLLGFVNANFGELIAEEIAYSEQVKAELEREANQIFILSLALLLGILAVCAGAGMFVAGRIASPIKRITAVADRVASGDLTAERIAIRSRDELGTLGAAFNQMLAGLKEMIAKVGASSGDVRQVAGQLQQSCAQSAAASDHIAGSIYRISEGAGTQAELSDRFAAHAHEVYRSVGAISRKTAQAKVSSDEALDLAREGDESLRGVWNQIHSMNTSIAESARVADELQQRLKEIDSILDLITEMATQTNLLSLNASIEAARAGEHGKGFAVVAGEVRKLSQQSGEAASRISGIVSVIRRETANLSHSMKRSMDEARAGMDVADLARLAFERIHGTITGMSEQMTEIDAEVRQIDAAVREIKDGSDQVASISKSFAENSQEVAASIEELNAGLQEVLRTAEYLGGLSGELQKLVNRFRLA
jgi:methyl-accepting chemotaxis protein